MKATFSTLQHSLVTVQKLLRFHTQPYLFVIVCYHILITFCCILSYCITPLLYDLSCYAACFLFCKSLFLFDHTVLHHVLMHCILT